MKASELITLLQTSISEYGDLQIAIFDDGSCRHDPWFRVRKCSKADEPTAPWAPDEALDDEFIALG